MSIQESLKVKYNNDIAVLEMDLVGEKVNKLSTKVMERFKQVIEEIGKSKAKVLIIRSLKPKIFVAGADIVFYFYTFLHTHQNLVFIFSS